MLLRSLAARRVPSELNATVPLHDSLVDAANRKRLIVRAEGEGNHSHFLQRVHRLPADVTEIPHDEFVATGCERPSISRECQTDAVALGCWQLRQLSSLEIPHPDHLVLVDRGKARPIRAENVTEVRRRLRDENTRRRAFEVPLCDPSLTCDENGAAISAERAAGHLSIRVGAERATAIQLPLPEDHSALVRDRDHVVSRPEADAVHSVVIGEKRLCTARWRHATPSRRVCCCPRRRRPRDETQCNPSSLHGTGSRAPS